MTRSSVWMQSPAGRGIRTVTVRRRGALPLSGSSPNTAVGTPAQYVDDEGYPIGGWVSHQHPAVRTAAQPFDQRRGHRRDQTVEIVDHDQHRHTDRGPRHLIGDQTHRGHRPLARRPVPATDRTQPDRGRQPPQRPERRRRLLARSLPATMSSSGRDLGIDTKWSLQVSHTIGAMGLIRRSGGRPVA